MYFSSYLLLLNNHSSIPSMLNTIEPTDFEDMLAALTHYVFYKGVCVFHYVSAEKYEASFGCSSCVFIILCQYTGRH